MFKPALNEITDIKSFVDQCEAAMQQMRSDEPSRRYQAYVCLEALIEGYEEQQLDNPQLGKFVSFCISNCADYYTSKKAVDEQMIKAGDVQNP